MESPETETGVSTGRGSFGSVAIAHKDYDVRGGGEFVAEELARCFDAPLYVGFRDEETEPPEEDVDIHGLFDDGLSGRLLRRGGVPAMLTSQIEWQKAPNLSDYETLITSGDEPLWFVPRDEQVLVTYTHTTPRWAYDLFHEWDNSIGGRLGQIYQQIWRIMYDHNTRRPDLFVANSDLVARRIRRYWAVPDEKIRVVYPPVPVNSYGREYATEDDDYYFTVSRHIPAKHIDEIISAFNGTERRLLVAGRGPDTKRLKEIADENVEFLGYITEEEKARRLAECKAFIFAAKNEDFGIAPIEAFASGVPVIGVAEGFTKYQIIDGESGYTYERGAENLRKAVDRFEADGVSWSAGRIESFADRFNVDRFYEEMRAAVSHAQESAQVEPPWFGTG